MVGRSDGRRQARVAETIRGELARLISRDVGDPTLAWVTITGVDTSPDLKRAKVHFVATGVDDYKPVQRSLEKAATFLQREIGRNLRLRNTPRLDFAYDESFDEAQKIDELIAEVQRDENAEAASHVSPERRMDKLVSDAEQILIATHRNPDGDAIGSLLGMHRILELMHKDHVTYCPDGVPFILQDLPGANATVRTLPAGFKPSLTILLDTADESLFPDGFPPQEARGTFVVVDHHKRHSEMGDVVIRWSAAAVGEMVYEIARKLMWPLDENVAECLYASVVADTGSFRYASSTPNTLRVAADLIELGAQPWRVATALYESYPVARQRLLGAVLQTLRVSKDGRFASQYASDEMIAQCGADKADLDGMVNSGRSIRGVEISALVRQKSDGLYRVSYRSKGNIDVGLLASRFDGGGHVNAAGCSIEAESVSAARDEVERAAIAFLAECEDSK